MMRITTSHYNYKKIVPFLAGKGRELFGDHFRLYPADLGVLIPIIGWMLRDEDVASQFGIDLGKGILLAGPIGCGKTRIMELMQLIVSGPLAYQLRHVDRVSAEYNKSGPAMFDQYTSDQDHIHRAWCFDNMGIEDPAYHYGSTCLVMRKILLGRYELYSKFGTVTHVTTNLSVSAIENRYGVEVRSRMGEMFNQLLFDKDTKDKRRTG